MSYFYPVIARRNDETIANIQSGRTLFAIAALSLEMTLGFKLVIFLKFSGGGLLLKMMNYIDNQCVK
jgi:hypothetical protein